MWIRRRYCSPRMSARLSSPEGFAELNALVSPENPSLGALEFGRQGGFVHGSHRYRVMRVKVLGGEEYTLRVLPAQVPTPSAVLLPEQLVKRFVELEDGLVVFAGATGHGKTTSIAALVGECARKSASRIISIEDPVEYIHPDLPNGSTFSLRGVGEHCKGFTEALEEALRMSPNVIVFGEIRTPEAAEIAIHAALSGHKVICTVHGGSVDMALQRIGDMCADLGNNGTGAFAQAFRIAVAQQLVPAPSGMLVPLHEILTYDKSVETKIRNGKYFTLRQDMEGGSTTGMQTFDQSRALHVAHRRLPARLT